MADDIGGVWRTIGGRRVFIRTGTTLQQAMKESGKFKNLGKKVKDAKYDAEQKRKELLARAFAQYGDMSREDEDYLNSLKTYEELKSELKNRGWDDLFQAEKEVNKSTEDNEKFKEMYKSSYDVWKEANPQLPDQEIIKILRAKQYNGELHPDIKKGSQDNLANQIKNFDNTKMSKDKWSAEEEFLARMKRGYDRYSNEKGKDVADEQIKNVKVISKNDDFLLYSVKGTNSEHIDYEVAKSYERGDDIGDNLARSISVDVEYDWQTGEVTGTSVNWAAMGSVDASTAEKYMQKLSNAVAVAKDAEKKLKGTNKWGLSVEREYYQYKKKHPKTDLSLEDYKKRKKGM